LPAEPGSLADITLVGDWATTGVAERKPFVIRDRGNDELECMLVFASEVQLRQLAVVDVWQPSVQALYPVSTALRSTHW